MLSTVNMLNSHLDVSPWKKLCSVLSHYIWYQREAGLIRFVCHFKNPGPACEEKHPVFMQGQAAESGGTDPVNRSTFISNV